MAEFVAAPEPAALSTEKDSSILGETHADPSSPDSVIPAFHEERENAEYASEEAEAEDVDDGSPSSPDVEPESPGPQPGAPSEDDALYGEELMALKLELGDTHIDTLTALNNRAAALFAQNDLKGAARLFKEAIKDKRGSLGAHTSTALSIANLGKLYKLSGKPKRAKEYLQEAFEMRRELLGKKHADTLQSANHYGSLLYSLRDYEAAERLLSDTLARSRKGRGDSDPITLTTINNLGNVLHSKGDLDGALPLLKEAVTSSRATLGAAHVDTLISIANLALLLKDMAFRGGSDGKGTNGEDPDAPSDEPSDAVAVGDFNGDGKVDEAERRRALVEEGQALLVEAARGFRQKRAELGETHPHVRSIGMPEWEADLDLSAYTVSQGAPAAAGEGGNRGGKGADGGAVSEAVDAETRAKLRQVFDKFDADGSGAVDTREMKAMIAQLELQLSDDEVARLMVEADPDGSGLVEFEEFVTVMAEQMKKGGGGLVDLVSAAGNLFGWINPMSWFGK